MEWKQCALELNSRYLNKLTRPSALFPYICRTKFGRFPSVRLIFCLSGAVQQQQIASNCDVNVIFILVGFLSVVRFPFLDVPAIIINHHPCNKENTKSNYKFVLMYFILFGASASSQNQLIRSNCILHVCV